MLVRLLQWDDLQEVSKLVVEFHKDSVFRDRPLNFERASGTICSSILRPHSNPAFVAIHDNKLVGFLRAYIVDCTFSDDKYAFEDFFYVHPDYRRHRAAPMLLRAFELWAKDNDVTRIVTGDSGTQDHRLARMYARRGYRVYATLFEKDVI